LKTATISSKEANEARARIDKKKNSIIEATNEESISISFNNKLSRQETTTKFAYIG
jgi:hypothetical protein